MTDRLAEDPQLRRTEIRRMISEVRHHNAQRVSEVMPTDAPVDTTFSIAEVQKELEELMKVVYTSCITLPMDPVGSPRRFIGKPITFVKKMFLRLIRPFSSMLLQPQIDFNENLAEELKVMNRILTHTLQDVSRIYAKFEALRLHSSDLEDENARLKAQIDSPAGFHKES